MGGIGAWELVIILILVLVIFGGNKIPQLGRGLGLAVANFRRSLKGDDGASKTDGGEDRL